MKKKTGKKSGRPDGFKLGLFGILSHQLKSPINSIESLLNVIADGFTGEVNQKTIDLVNRALAKTGEARALINDLLHLEKYSGEAPVKEAAELSGIVSGLFNRHHAAAAEKNILYSLKMPPGRKIIFSGDRAGIELALGNLVDNAVKYTPQNGSVSVEVSIDPETRRAAVNVSDSGPGIAPEDLPRLFEPFFRSPREKNHASGTGLGLAIARRIMRAHGGEINVSSEPGRGTRFRALLPFESIEQSEEKPKKRVVIIGGVTAGPKAAARLRRLDEDLDITIIEKSEFLSYAGCGIPAYLAGRVSSPKALMSTADATLRDVHFFEHIKNIKIMNKTRAEAIDRGKKEVTVRNLASERVATVPYDILILATGSCSVVPPIPGIDGPHVVSLYNIEDAERIKSLFSRRLATDVFIIGGGLVGIETAESLMASGARVSILEKDENILKLFDPDVSLKIREVLSLKGVKVHTGVDIREIIHGDSQCRILTGSGDFTCDLVILSTGVKPNAELGIKAGLAAGALGGIAVDETLKTSDPAIFAIGDCAETKNILGKKTWYLPLGSISTKMGRIAADNIAGVPVAFPGALGTTHFRIFDVAVGRTGLSEAEAKQEGFNVVTVIAGGLDHSHYSGGAEDIVLKVLADRASKKLLGAQGYGRGDVVSRIEILAAALAAGMTLPEIFALDLGYSPAFNNPIDMLQTACAVLENKIDGIVRSVTPSEFDADRGKYTVLDLSPIADFSFHSIPGSINIPLENLRGANLNLFKGKPLVLCSRTSSRAYEAYRYLLACGMTDMRVLEGGYLYYRKG